MWLGTSVDLCSKVSKRLRFLNNFLPKDHDPVHAWSVVFFIFILTLAGKNAKLKFIRNHNNYAAFLFFII